MTATNLLQLYLWIYSLSVVAKFNTNRKTLCTGKICVKDVHQGRSHQIWSDQVDSARVRALYPRGAWGHAPPGKLWNLWAMRLLLRPILSPSMLLGDQTTEFHLNAILHIASYTNGVGFPIQFAYQPKATPIAGEACETNRKNGKLLEDSRNSSVEFQHGTYALRGVAWASAKQWR